MQRAPLYLWQRYTGNQEVTQGNMSRKVKEKVVGTKNLGHLVFWAPCRQEL